MIFVIKIAIKNFGVVWDQRRRSLSFCTLRFQTGGAGADPVHVAEIVVITHFLRAAVRGGAVVAMVVVVVATSSWEEILYSTDA